MSAKTRPPVDWAALTSETAAPMSEAVQRTAPPLVPPPPSRTAEVEQLRPVRATEAHTTTPNLEGLAFKVPPAFRKRFRTRAAEANLKLNELLFEAFEAWERGQGFKK